MDRDRMNDVARPPLAITRAAHADLDVVTELLRAQLVEHSLPTASTREAVLGVLDEPSRGFFLLAREGGAPIGVACVCLMWSVELGGPGAWLDELYVVPHARGRGVGRELLEAVYREVLAAGSATLDLEVTEDHRRVIGLYQREGFEGLGRTRFRKAL